jgi:hypothetical protein
MTHTPHFESITSKIDMLMSGFSHSKKNIGYGYRRTFENKMRFDIIDYSKKWTNILRVGRGARLVRQYPVLCDWFDEVNKVIAKIEIKDVAVLHEKHIIGVLELLHDAPVGIKVFD